MGRRYSAVFDGVAVTAVQDFFRVSAPSDAIVVIHSVSISQGSDAGDAESEMLRMIMHRGSTDGGGGSTPTPSPLNSGDAAFGGTVGANNTTQSTDGAVLRAESFNVLAGYLWQPTPEERPVVSPSGRFVVALETAPTDSLTMSGTIIFEEVGG